MANTNAIVAAQGAGSYAAKLCADLVLNGYGDWYLPSINELHKLYSNRSSIGEFTTDSYWSSSELSSSEGVANLALAIFFGTGATYGDSKHVANRVRAVRSF
jgi:hypothetical protein